VLDSESLCRPTKTTFIGSINLKIAAIPTALWQVMRFLTNPHKPMILALSRPDPKKNITTLVKAFGECRPLRELANLVSDCQSEAVIFHK